MEMSWQCTVCRSKNAAGAKRCALCRNPYTGAERTEPKIESAQPREWEEEEDSKVFDALNARIVKASAEMEESLPPKAAIRIVVPNNPLGLLTVVIVVVALAMTLAVLKTMF